MYHIYHNNEDNGMGKKQHFAIVPDRLIAKRDPKRLQLYCELYMLEVSNQSYNLRHFAKDKKVSYNIVYSLLRIVREHLSNSRVKKDSNKQSKNSDKKNTKSFAYKTDKHEVEQLKNTKSSQRTTKNIQKSENESARTPEVSGAFNPAQLESELELESNERTEENLLLSAVQILGLSEEERTKYINKNRDALTRAGII